MESFALIEKFFRGIFFALNMSDFAIPMGLILWSVVLFMKLERINCEDLFSGLMYTAYCAVTGVVLVIAMPRKFHPFDNFKAYTAWIILFIGVAGLRWMKQFITQKNAMTKITKKGE